MLAFDHAAARHVRATLPGEAGLPIVGRSLDFLRDPIAVGLSLYEKYGPVGWIDGFGQTSVFAIGPDANQVIFRDANESFSHAEGWGYFIGEFFHRGLMLLDFDEHRFHRGVMQSAFKHTALERYFERMQPIIRRTVASYPTWRTIRLNPRMKQLTLDVATHVFMGEKLGRESTRVNHAFVDAVRGGTALVRHPVPFSRWKRGLDGRKTLEAFIRDRLPAKRRNPSDDLFSKLCEATDDEGNRFTDDDIVNHMIFLMMAAHDTSTITTTSIFYRLAKNRIWQDRVRDEIRSLGGGELTLDALRRLPSLDLVMKEAMRLLTPVPGLARKTVKEVEILGHRIPAGVPITVSPGATHRLPDYWSNPDRFDPERFAEGRNEHRRHTFLYVPFGGGAHKCIGMHFGEMEVKSIVCHVLSRYELSVDASYEMPVDYTSLPVPKDGLPLRLRRI